MFAQDPEDDDLPLKPKLFIENVFSGSKMATSKAGAEDAETTPKPVSSNHIASSKIIIKLQI